MAALSLSELRSYVSGGAARAVSGSVALLDVQHSLIQQRFVEIPFDIFMPLAAVKAKVYSLCGTAPEHQQLHLNSADGPLLTGSLAQCGLRSGSGGGIGCSLFVLDCDPFALGRNGALHDVRQVKKYEMSDDEYNSRDNTYRAFKQRMRQQDPHWQSLYEKQRQRQTAQDDAGEEESIDSLQSRFPLQSRCQISPGDRRGRIRYVGAVAGLSSSPSAVWVGVELDEPSGGHSGSVGGVAYFSCPPRHGAFVRPAKLRVGDFPELDPLADSEGEEDESEQKQQHDARPTQATAQAQAQASVSELYEEL